MRACRGFELGVSRAKFLTHDGTFALDEQMCTYTWQEDSPPPRAIVSSGVSPLLGRRQVLAR